MNAQRQAALDQSAVAEATRIRAAEQAEAAAARAAQAQATQAAEAAKIKAEEEAAAARAAQAQAIEEAEAAKIKAEEEAAAARAAQAKALMEAEAAKANADEEAAAARAAQAKAVEQAEAANATAAAEGMSRGDIANNMPEEAVSTEPSNKLASTPDDMLEELQKEADREVARQRALDEEEKARGEMDAVWDALKEEAAKVTHCEDMLLDAAINTAAQQAAGEVTSLHALLGTYDNTSEHGPCSSCQ